MDYSEFYRDFFLRTLANLKQIEKIAKEGSAPAYEVTQLVNSLLGLVVFVREEMKGGLKLVKKKFPQLPSPYIPEKGPPAKCLGEQIYHVRNAVAHAGVEAISNNKRLITGLRFTNQFNGKTWVLTFTLQNLKDFVKAIEAALRAIWGKKIPKLIPESSAKGSI